MQHDNIGADLAELISSTMHIMHVVVKDVCSRPARAHETQIGSKRHFQCVVIDFSSSHPRRVVQDCISIYQFDLNHNWPPES